MAVEAARDEEIRDRDAVGRLGPFGREGGEGRGGDGGAEVEVGERGEEDVEGGGEDLEHVGGAHGLLRVPHLGDQDEEHEVPRVGEHGVRHADEGAHEVCGCRDGRAASWRRVQACAHHADYPGHDDADDGGDGEPGEAVEGAREGADEGGDREDAGVEH